MYVYLIIIFFSLSFKEFTEKSKLKIHMKSRHADEKSRELAGEPTDDYDGYD